MCVGGGILQCINADDSYCLFVTEEFGIFHISCKWTFYSCLPLKMRAFLFQTVQHKLAELKTEICVGRAFIDSCLQLHALKQLDSATASMAKYW